MERLVRYFFGIFDNLPISWTSKNPNYSGCCFVCVLYDHRYRVGLQTPPHQLRGLGSAVSFRSGVRAEPRPQIHFGPTKSLENVSSGRKCRTHFIFLLSTSGPAEPLDTTGWTGNPGWKSLLTGTLHWGFARERRTGTGLVRSGSIPTSSLHPWFYHDSVYWPTCPEDTSRIMSLSGSQKAPRSFISGTNYSCPHKTCFYIRGSGSIKEIWRSVHCFRDARKWPTGSKCTA